MPSSAGIHASGRHPLADSLQPAEAGQQPALRPPTVTCAAVSLLAICETGAALRLETCVRRGAGRAATMMLGCMCPEAAARAASVGVEMMAASHQEEPSVCFGTRGR